MFERVPLPETWPVFVTWAEAAAYARWSGRRLPTEAEFHRAAFGTPDGDERRFPWGDSASPSTGALSTERADGRGRAPGNFDFYRWDPEPAGAHPDGASGNVASEDVLYMLDGLGIETGGDLDEVIETGRFISTHLGRPSGSKVNRALVG